MALVAQMGVAAVQDVGDVALIEAGAKPICVTASKSELEGTPPATSRRPYLRCLYSFPTSQAAAAGLHTRAGLPALRCCTGRVSTLRWPYPWRSAPRAVEPAHPPAPQCRRPALAPESFAGGRGIHSLHKVQLRVPLQAHL
jgi:hypothetical protein